MGVVLTTMGAVLAVLAAPAMALLGVYIGGLNSRKQTQMQLEHAAKEAAIKRTFDMRQSVYLSGAEALARASAIIGRMGDPSLADDEIRIALAESSAAMAKVQIVAGIDTVDAIADFNTEILAAVSRMWPKRWDLLALKSRLDNIGEQLQLAVEAHGRFVERQTQLSIQGPQNSEELPKVAHWIKGVSGHVNDLIQRRSALQQELSAAVASVTEAALTEIQPVAAAAVSLLARIREEFGLSSDQDRLSEVRAFVRQRTTAILEGLLAEAKARSTAASSEHSHQ